MVSNKSFICETCNYYTNRKYNLELHKRSPNACEKRLKRDEKKSRVKIVANFDKTVAEPGSIVANFDKTVAEPGSIVADFDKTVADQLNNDTCCKICSKTFTTKRSKDKHEEKCNGVHSLQCPTCKVEFTSKFSKYRHIKKANCEFVLTDEQQKIKDLEDQLEECGKELEEEKKKRQEAEKKSNTTINNYNITNNNYFDHSINYNNYDNLNVDHITKEDIKRLFNNCRMQYPELSEDLTRMILSPKENQCIYLPEGQKSNTCAVIKDGVEMRKPLIRVLMDLGVQAATLIRDSNVIVRNKKDIVNNQFWADNRNACGLNISDIEYMTDNDKEIVQRNKNIVLDMSDGKI